MRDDALKEIASWLCQAGRHVWFRIPDPSSAVPERFAAQFADWRLTLGLERAPPCVHDQHCFLSWVGWFHVCGSASTIPPMDDPGHLPYRDAAAIFKSIKRHLLRNEFRNARQWIRRFAMHSDPDYIERSITMSGDARLAWAFLLWWQACTGAASLREWFLPRGYENAKDRQDCFFPWASRPSREAVTPSQLWVAGWIQVARLKFVLSNAIEAAGTAVAEKKAIWGRGAMENSTSPSWSTGTSREGWLCISLDQPNISF